MKRNRFALMVTGLLAALALAGCGEDLTCGDSTTGEGSIAIPIGLGIGSPRAAQVGGAIGSDRSYYSFVASATSHTISVTGVSNSADLYNKLYSGADFATGSFGTCNTPGPNSSENCTAGGLSVSSPYYIEVYNQTCNSTPYSITVTL